MAGLISAMTTGLRASTACITSQETPSDRVPSASGGERCSSRISAPMRPDANKLGRLRERQRRNSTWPARRARRMARPGTTVVRLQGAAVHAGDEGRLAERDQVEHGERSGQLHQLRREQRRRRAGGVQHDLAARPEERRELFQMGDAAHYQPRTPPGRRTSAPPSIMPVSRSATMAQTQPAFHSQSRHQFTWWPSSAERGAGLVGEAALQADAAGRVGVRVGRAGEAEGGEAGLLDGGLRGHVEDEHVEQDLQHRLRLHVVAGRAEGDEVAAVLDRERRAGGEARALAGREAGGMVRVGPGLHAARGGRDAGAGDDRRVEAAIAGGGGEAVALASRPRRHRTCPAPVRTTPLRARAWRRGVGATSPKGGISGQALAGSIRLRRSAA